MYFLYYSFECTTTCIITVNSISKFKIDHVNSRGMQNFSGASESFEYGGFQSEEDFDDEDFFDDVITGRQSMSGDDSTWEITKNMSPELLSLFGVVY